MSPPLLLLPQGEGRDEGRAAPALTLLATLLLATPTQARTITAGQGADYPTLDAAARLAKDGDTIRLLPGEYFDCAQLPQNDLVLEGQGAVLTDKTCAGKALLVLLGNGITVRDLTLTRARVPDGNGAGIRLEGTGLTLERVHFVNDQAGLIAGTQGGIVRLTECSFEDTGTPGDRPLAAILAGPLDTLRIERTTFRGGKGGQLASAATRTELLGNDLAGTTEPGGPPAISITGPTLLMDGNTLTIGPALPRQAAAILATGTTAELRRNRLVNTTGTPLALLLDWTSGTPKTAGNTIAAGDTEISTAGIWRHRASTMARATNAALRTTAASAKQGLKSLLGR